MSTDLKMSAHSEILIAPGGQILAHNLTPEMAAVLAELNPSDDMMRTRAGGMKMKNGKNTIKIKSRMKTQERTDGPVFGVPHGASRTS